MDHTFLYCTTRATCIGFPTSCYRYLHNSLLCCHSLCYSRCAFYSEVSRALELKHTLNFHHIMFYASNIKAQLHPSISEVKAYIASVASLEEVESPGTAPLGMACSMKLIHHCFEYRSTGICCKTGRLRYTHPASSLH